LIGRSARERVFRLAEGRNVTRGSPAELGRSVVCAAVASYDLIKDLPLEIDSYELQGLEFSLPDADFDRLTTIIHLKGGGHEGLGEDVVYDSLDHIAFQDAGPVLDLAGKHTIGSFSELLDGAALFPSPPEREVSVNYRRWAFESAALDLALRQAGKSLHEVVGREARPVTFVVSMRLTPPGSDQVSTIEPVRKRLEIYPTLRFKLDPTNDWTDELIGQLVETGAVDSLDLKGQYKGTPVDVETDPELYRKLIEAFPDAWLEDPDVSDQTKPILDPVADRVTWDAVIHSVADIKGQVWPPKMVNIKPSRFGPLHELFAAYDYCDENGIGAYGGGQWELGPGRGHIQYLASLFHPDTPNDVAPSGYNTAGTEPGLPSSPLQPMPTETGFRWGE
jgi:L-alanine-DL-glutamate epimerase-like enolase superfamily enzyme